MSLMVNELSVFIPTYNDEETIGKLILDAIYVLDPLKLDYEIIIVDDGSSDATAKIVKRLAKTYKTIKLIQHGDNRDYGAALRTGFAAATKEWVFYTDGDGQYDIKEITRLLSYTEDFVFINGCIVKRNDPLYRIFLGKVYQFLIDTCFGKTIVYTNCDFRLVKKEIMDRITINSNSGFAPAEIIVKLARNGVKAKEVLISHFSRQYGHSQFFNFRKICSLISDFLRFLVYK
jgi:glycosyltransferase involved in cell wall biosynthesis